MQLKYACKAEILEVSMVKPGIKQSEAVFSGILEDFVNTTVRPFVE